MGGCGAREKDVVEPQKSGLDPAQRLVEAQRIDRGYGVKEKVEVEQQRRG
jgi:hypothetical protein